MRFVIVVHPPGFRYDFLIVIIRQAKAIPLHVVSYLEWLQMEDRPCEVMVIHDARSYQFLEKPEEISEARLNIGRQYTNTSLTHVSRAL